MAPVLLSLPAGVGARAATIAPPMLDITRQCDANTRHNATAMSECVVAESEARSEVLQKWGGLSDASAEKCIKLGRKAKRFPYTAMAKCLAVEKVDVRPLVKPAEAEGAPQPSIRDRLIPSWLSSPLKH